MDEDSATIGWLPWAQGNRLICKLRTFRGRTGLDLRIHYLDSETEVWRPTKKGLWVPIERTQEFRDLLDKVYSRLESTVSDSTQERTSGEYATVERERKEADGAPAVPSAPQSESNNIDVENDNAEGDGIKDDPEKRMNEWLQSQ